MVHFGSDAGRYIETGRFGGNVKIFPRILCLCNEPVDSGRRIV